jgi:hypothetical protein
MVPTFLLNVPLVDATTSVGAPWLALGGIAVAIREFWMGLRAKRA